MAAGFYGPEPPNLARIRQTVAWSPERWLAVEAALRDAGLSLSRESALARLPKGFEAQAGSAVAETLKLKSFIVLRQLTQDQLGQPSLVDTSSASPSRRCRSCGSDGALFRRRRKAVRG